MLLGLVEELFCCLQLIYLHLTLVFRVSDSKGISHSHYLWSWSLNKDNCVL